MLVIILKIDKEKYIEHINDKEQIINMRKVLDKVEIALNKHSLQSTDFMDPYERKLAKSILNRFQDIEYKELGGIDVAERKVISVYPDYLQYKFEENPIKSLMIEGYTSNFSHRDFLGAILNLGIIRGKVGDILIHEGYTQIVVKKEISSYILNNLEKVANENVIIKEIPLDDLKPPNVEYKYKKATISSLRLDVLISSTWNLSRKDSQRIVESGRVKVNWEPIDKASKEIDEGDVISTKGYGRFILSSIEGTSKKGKIKVELKLLK